MLCQLFENESVLGWASIKPSIKPSCKNLAAVCCGAFHRSFSSVWLKRTWEHWEDWTEGGEPAELTSKPTHYHCSHGSLKLILQFWLFSSLSARIKSHPYYPFEWGSQTENCIYWHRKHQPDQLHAVYLQRHTQCGPAGTSLPNNDEMLQWWLYKLGIAAGQRVFNTEINNPLLWEDRQAF